MFYSIHSLSDEVRSKMIPNSINTNEIIEKLNDKSPFRESKNIKEIIKDLLLSSKNIKVQISPG